jgi:HPt (histidine-containing phosphotransfer) domain-containing protein
MDLSVLVREITDLSADRAQRKGIQLKADIATNIPRFVAIDPQSLRQILGYLLDNAITCTNRGHVTVQVRLVSRRLGSVQLQFSVTDTGLGMPAETQMDLPGASSQSDGSSNRRNGDSESSLARCHQLAQRMNGTLRVEGAAGIGSTYHLTVRADIPSGFEPGPDPNGTSISPIADPELAALIPAYLSRRYNDVLACRRALEVEDYATICALVHNMAGSGGFYGFSALTEYARALERTAKQQDAAAVRLGLQVLEEVLMTLIEQQRA